MQRIKGGKNMSRQELLKLTNMVYDVGESTEHFISMDFDTRKEYVDLYIFDKNPNLDLDIVDSITVYSLDEEALAWIERWTERLRKERVEV